MRLIAVLFLAFLLLAPALASAGPYDDGQSAYRNGDYQTALKIWKPLAVNGNADAQISLGYMYRHGKGVKQNDAEAEKLFRMAADQGDGRAQLALGYMYEDEKDYENAYFWLSLSSMTVQVKVGGNDFAPKQSAASRLTSDQKAAVDKRVAEWKPTPAPAEAESK